MNWKVIKTKKEHKKAEKRATEIFHADPGTPKMMSWARCSCW